MLRARIVPESDNRRGEPFPALDSRRDALLLDIDGTILDIATTPEAVTVPESLKRDLGRVRDRLDGALALVSGRTLDSVDALFAPLRFAAVGCHGAELRAGPDAAIERPGVALPAAVKAVFADVAKLDHRIHLEDKHYALSLHYRKAAELENTIFAMVNARLSMVDRELEVVCGKAVIEIKDPGFNKGTGCLELMRRPPFTRRRPIFFGDDTTDEDVFAVLGRLGGVGISVGALLPGASSCVATPGEVRDWLAHLAKGFPE